MPADNLSMKIQHFILVLFLLVPAVSFAADDKKENESVKVNGIVFNIAKDRKIEKIGGVYEPEGIDKYVDRRMSEMTERLQRIEIQLDETNKKLDKVFTQLASTVSVSAPTSAPIPTKDKTKK